MDCTTGLVIHSEKSAQKVQSKLVKKGISHDVLVEELF